VYILFRFSIPISTIVFPINQQLLDYQSQTVQGRDFFHSSLAKKAKKQKSKKAKKTKKQNKTKTKTKTKKKTNKKNPIMQVTNSVKVYPKLKGNDK